MTVLGWCVVWYAIGLALFIIRQLMESDFRYKDIPSCLWMSAFGLLLSIMIIWVAISSNPETVILKQFAAKKKKE